MKCIAHQIGSQVSYNEIGQQCGISSKTVENYIDILEKCFLIFKLPSYSMNKRNELKKSKKIYFVDTGIRNFIINDFNYSEDRQDLGNLFENYIIAERYKMNVMNKNRKEHNFWRNKQGSEIDLIEQKDRLLECFEIKFNPKKKANVPLAFKNLYDNFTFKTINKDNYFQYLS